MPNRYYISVTTSPTSVVAENASRDSIAIINTSPTEIIYVDFGIDPSATNGAWRIIPNGSLILSRNQFPEIGKDVRIVATAACNAIIRDSVS